jgi:hypothetical protein
MIAAYLTEPEIVRTLQLPEKVGRAKMKMWKLDPTFPKPEPGTGGRRFWPEVERWLRRHHGIDAVGTISDRDGGRENFNDWREQRKARKASKAKGIGNARAGVSPSQVELGSAVVTPFRPGQSRLSGNDVPPVAAVRRDPTSA